MITSSHNPKLQRVRDLFGRSRERRQQGAFVAEGVRLLEEALVSNYLPELVLHSSTLSPRGQECLQRFRTLGAEVEEVSPDLLDGLSATETSQGILAVLPIREIPIPKELDFVLIADAVRDPGNLGTLLRSAAAAAVQAVLLGPGTVDPYSPKVVRSAMGAHFRLPLRTWDWETIRMELKGLTGRQPLAIYLAEAEQGQSCWELDLRSPVALLVGGEASGPGEQARALADARVHIPMPGKSESLNAAVAASILLFEIVRQRGSSIPGGS